MSRDYKETQLKIFNDGTQTIQDSCCEYYNQISDYSKAPPILAALRRARVVFVQPEWAVPLSSPKFGKILNVTTVKQIKVGT